MHDYVEAASDKQTEAANSTARLLFNKCENVVHAKRLAHRRSCMRRMTPILKLITFNNQNVLLACPITVAFNSFYFYLFISLLANRSSNFSFIVSSTKRTMRSQPTTSGGQNNVFLFPIWPTSLLLLRSPSPRTALAFRFGVRVKNLRICANGVLLRW